MIISWFSCGVTSAVACKIALQMYEDVHLYYIDTGSHEEDSMRFLRECEEWYGRPIKILRSGEFTDHFDVIQKRNLISTHHYFPCTYELKKQVRYKLEDELGTWDGQVWGFDFGELNRAKRMSEQYPDMKPLYPLIEQELTKENCAYMLGVRGIELPKMYRMGYRNNNCVGCVRGGMGYWNKIRTDFPDHFDRMAKIERQIGHSCLKNTVGEKTTPLFLDELAPDRGDFPTEIMPECGLFCPLEFV